MPTSPKKPAGTTKKDVSMPLGRGKVDSIKIETFKLEMFEKYPAIIMIAKRGSGKSWVVRAILQHFKDIPAGLIIAPTDRMNCFYGKFFPDSYIFYEYKSEVIERVLERQQKIIEKQQEKIRQGKNIDTRSFIIMDDCLGQKGSWARDQPIQELLFNGRHYHIMYILTMQFPLGISPELRSNFDYIFLLADDYVSNMKRMYEHYAGMFPSFDAFKQVFAQLTSDYGSMVIVNRGARNNLFEKVFHYKAPDCTEMGKDTKFGCKQFREFDKNNYNQNWRKKVLTSNPKDVEQYFLQQKKNKKTIVVERSKAPGEFSENMSEKTQFGRGGHGSILMSETKKKQSYYR